MEINVSKEEKTCIIAPVGRVDTLTAPELEQAVQEHAEKCQKLILDFKDVDYISSAGLRVIVSAHREMAGKDGMVLRGLNKNVRTIINMTGFNKKLNIEE